MWNAGPEPARIIELYTPGGFELFFEDFGERLRQGPIGLDELNRLGKPHGIRFFARPPSGLQRACHRRVARRERSLAAGPRARDVVVRFVVATLNPCA